MRSKIIFCVIISILINNVVALQSHRQKLENLEINYKIIQEGTFTTRLDHFRPQDNRTVSFKYYSNFNNYKDGGPIYIYLGDDGESVTKWIEGGLMVDISRRTNGALFTYYRRFYGQNIPTDTSKINDLDYLTFDQVLADVATFIDEIKQKHKLNSTIIVWGSDTGAVLAAAARQKYPHLVNGAWASSGIFDFKVESYRAYDILESIIVDGGDISCDQRVQHIFETLDHLFKNNSREYLKTIFNLCHPVLNETSDVAAFFDAQLNFIIDYFNAHHFVGVQNFCHDIDSSDPLVAYARWINYVYGDVDDHCFDYSYSKILELNSGNEWNSNGNRQEYFWRCTELGNFMITDKYSWLPNRVDSEYRAQLCLDIFGNEYDHSQLYAANDALKLHIGNLKRVTNVIYTNMGIDPWHYSGMQWPGNAYVDVLEIPYYGKSADLQSIGIHDSEILRNAKEKIMQKIFDWSLEKV